VLVIVMRVGALDGPPPCEPHEVECERAADDLVVVERGDVAGDDDE
jgi:hypothetical protein